MIESLEGNVPGAMKYGSKWYLEDMAYSQQANSRGDWSAKTIAGVTNVGKKSESGKNEYFFYDRNSYDLNFYNPTLFNKKVTLKYGSSIANQNYTPPRPSGVSTDYVFTGWYTNTEGAGSPFNFTNATMPENNLALYSKWAPPVVSVGYYETQDGGELKKTVDIPEGGTIDETQLSKLDLPGVDFAGWYWYLDGIFVPYDFNTPVLNNNYVLYPVWKDTIYKVTYDAGLVDGVVPDGTVPEDNNNYISGAAANVKSPTDLTPPTGKVFNGWKNLNNPTITYYPNGKLVINGNMTLTAQWGDIVPDTTLTYKANGGVGSDEVVSGLKNNDTHIVKLGNTFTRAGYEFIEWNTKLDGSGDSFQPGVKIIVSNDDDPIPNELYALWAKKITVTAANASKPYDGLPLTKDEATASGLLPGHTMSDVTVTGSQTLVGTSSNIASGAVIKFGSNRCDLAV